MFDTRRYPCIAMYRVFVDLTDSVDGAVFISQLLYWSQRMQGDWFYKTREDWYLETGIKKDRQVTLCKKLITLGILEIKRHGLPARTYYRFNQLKLQHCVEQLPHHSRYQRPIQVTDASELSKNETKEAEKPRNHQMQEIPTTRYQENRHQDDPLTSRLDSPSTDAAQSVVLSPVLAASSCRSNPQPYDAQSVNLMKLPASVYKEHKITHKTTHKITTENTTESKHKNTFVELDENLSTRAIEQKSTAGLFSTTEKHHNPMEKSGNSPQAVRCGVEEPGCVNQLSQPIAIPSHDVAHQEMEPDVGEQHLQAIQENLALSRKTDNRVADIFTHWQTVMQHPNARLDGKRKRLINAALKMGYTADEIKQAINGCGQTPHNLGDNDRGQRYDGLHIILRDADQIDRFMQNAVNPPRKLNAQEQLEADNKRIADVWINKHGLSPVGETIINPGDEL